MRHHTKEERHEVLHELECGMTINEAVQKYEISRYTIRRWRLEAGGPLPRQSFTLKEKAEILIAMEEEGLSDAEAAATADVNISTIRTWKKAKPRILAAYRAQGSEKSARTMQARVMQSSYGVEHKQAEYENTDMDKKEERALKRENEYLKAKNAYLESLLESLGYEPEKLKKNSGARKKGIGNIRLLCSIADVSRKSYYAYLKRVGQDTENDAIAGIIREEQESHASGIGYRPMTRIVSDRLGKHINSKRIREIMRDNDLQSQVRRMKFRKEVYAARRAMKGNVPADLVKRRFFAMAPLQKLVEDITYLTGCDGTLYLNTIEDMYNGEILAYAISSSPDSALCIETVKKLHEGFQNLDGVILHTDLGSSYMSAEYRSIAEGFGLRLSTGRTAICYDNAAIESLNGIIKTEALYCRFGKTRVKDRRIPVAQLKSAVIEFIDYYNNRRPKRKLGFLSPVEFRKQNPKGTYLMVLTEEQNG